MNSCLTLINITLFFFLHISLPRFYPLALQISLHCFSFSKYNLPLHFSDLSLCAFFSHQITHISRNVSSYITSLLPPCFISNLIIVCKRCVWVLVFCDFLDSSSMDFGLNCSGCFLGQNVLLYLVVSIVQ